MSTSTLRIPRRSSGPRDEDSATNTGPGRPSYAPVVLSMAADAGEMSERTLQSRHSGVFSRLNFKKESSDIDVELVDLEVNESRRTTDRTPNELPGGQRVSWNKGKKPFPSAASPILDDGASDFERALRDVMEKCVTLVVCRISPRLLCSTDHISRAFSGGSLESCLKISK